MKMMAMSRRRGCMLSIRSRSRIHHRRNRHSRTLHLHLLSSFLLFLLLHFPSHLLFTCFHQLRPRTRQNSFSRILNPPNLLLPPLNILFRIIITPKPYKLNTYPKPFNMIDTLLEPYHRDTYHSHPLDERSNRIRHGRGLREEDKRKNVLQEMDGAVEEKVDGSRITMGRRRTMRWMSNMGIIRRSQ